MCEKATYTTGFPHIGPALVHHPDFDATDLSSLREGYQQVLLPPERRTADPSLRVAQLGMTETCSSHTWWPPHEQVPEAKRGSLGVAAPGFEHKVIDDVGNEVPSGVTGEICVRGTALLRGMIGKQWHEVVDRDGWLHTKDAGYRDDDGHLYFAGRTDVTFARPDLVQCDDATCPYVVDGRSLFADANHMTAAAVARFRNIFEEALGR